MAWKRWTWIVIVAAVVIAGIVYGLRPQPVDVEVAAVTRGPLRVTVTEEGKTRIRNRYTVSAPVAGFLRRVQWKEGDAVAAGQVAARIDPRRPEVLDARTREQNEARLKSAQAALHVAEAQLAQTTDQTGVARAEADYWAEQRKREQVLLKTGDIPAEQLAKTSSEAQRTQAALKTAETAVETARAEVEHARAEVETARAALANPGEEGSAGASDPVEVRWPVTGRVLRVIKESEGFIEAGAPLIELGNVRSVEVEVELLSADAVRVGPGTLVLLTQWGGDATLEARVRTVEPSGFTKISALGVEEQRVKVISDITSPEQEWKRLGDGYRVEASFVLWQGDNVLQVPTGALFRDGGKWAVLVIDNGVARKQIVEVGHRNGLSAEILSGLQEGQSVINHPGEGVEDGKTVRAGS